MRAVGNAASASSYGRKRPISVSASTHRNVSTFGVIAAAASATSTVASEAISSRASQSSTM